MPFIAAQAQLMERRAFHAELADEHSIHVGKKRVPRRMRGLQPPKYVTTTVSDPGAERALDKVDRDFSADSEDAHETVEDLLI